MFKMIDLNLLPKLVGVYADPTLSVGMFVDLTRTVFNLCLNIFSPSQTCPPHQVDLKEKKISVCNLDAEEGSIFGKFMNHGAGIEQKHHDVTEEETDGRSGEGGGVGDGHVKQQLMDPQVLCSRMMEQ